MRKKRQIKVSVRKIQDHHVEHPRYTNLQKEFCSSQDEKINMTGVQGVWERRGKGG